jgi:hypothetical protein
MQLAATRAWNIGAIEPDPAQPVYPLFTTGSGQTRPFDDGLAMSARFTREPLEFRLASVFKPSNYLPRKSCHKGKEILRKILVQGAEGQDNEH